MYRTYYRNFGFTLIELMVVIAIIAILAGLMIPNYMRSRNEARLSACKQNLRTLAAALEGYATDNNGVYPARLVDLVDESHPYIKTMPVCPVCGDSSSYENGYSKSENPNCFTVVCHGDYHAACDLAPNFPGYSPLRGGFNNEAQANGSEGTMNP